MAEYYVSADGDDANDGSIDHPWKTITRVNLAFNGQENLRHHNRVRFRRGDTFYGCLQFPSFDASIAGWLRVGAYGTASGQPVICGYKKLNIASGWVQHDANTWKIDYSASAFGVTHTGYDSAQGTGDVGLLKIDGQIWGDNKYTLAELTDQWDYYSDGTTLYVRSSAKPTSLASEILCNLDLAGVTMNTASELADVTVIGYGALGVSFQGGATRCRLLRCTIAEIGGSYLDTRRYGNGVQAWTGCSDIYCEYNVVRDCYDTAWTIQGGIDDPTSKFENIMWRRNLTYRCSQAEEYWYDGTGQGYINCVSEYNTHLFPGYNWSRGWKNPDGPVLDAVLTYYWGNPNDLTTGPTLRRNIFYDPYQNYSYHAFPPTGMVSDHNYIYMRAGKQIQYQSPQTIEQSAAWAASVGREQHSTFITLPSWNTEVITDAEISATLTGLDNTALTGQLAGSGKVLPIHAYWRS